MYLVWTDGSLSASYNINNYTLSALLSATIKYIIIIFFGTLLVHMYQVMTDSWNFPDDLFFMSSSSFLPCQNCQLNLVSFEGRSTAVF